MNTTKIGTEYENRVFEYFSSLLEKDDIPGASKKHSIIQLHPKYKTSTGRVIDCDITIENYNPVCQDKWSSMVVIECKRYKSKPDIADLDEFQQKIHLISESGVKGIFVTTVGFSSNFIKQAQKAHIGLLVLSDKEEKWYACRNLSYRTEDQMAILCGQRQIGAFPIIYHEEYFVDMVQLLKKLGVNLSNKMIIDIPYMKKSEIEDLANGLYKKYRFSSNDIAGEIIAKEYNDYRIRFDDMPMGVLGSLSLSEKVISVSNEIINDVHRRNFTLAHEIGHLILHRKLLLGKMDKIQDYSMHYASQIPEQIIKRIEIQANYFASYLLMPRDLLIRKLSTLNVKYGMTKGYLFLDNQPCNQRDVNMILTELSYIFNVSKEAVKIRLEEMNLLRGKNFVKRIDEII